MQQRDQLVGGRYRLVEKIGEGGMGTVWGARDAQTDTDVAVKVLHKTLIADRSAVARFENEARVAAALANPFICGVIDVGEVDDAPFMVMERLRGENLGERLAREHQLPPEAAVTILLEVLGALDTAHTAGVLHRDLKPENVYLAMRDDGTEHAKILDFGVAKFIGDDAARVKMTRTGALVGTPAYMSPEQAMGQDDIDVRSDVWAAGVLLYEMLSGRLPYDAQNYNAMLVKIATHAPQPLETWVPRLDAGLGSIVRDALAREREGRIATAGAMASLLRTWQSGGVVPSSTRRVSLPTPYTGTTPMSWAESSSPPASTRMITLRGEAPSRRWLMPTVLGVVLGVVGLTIWRGAMRHDRATSASVRMTAMPPAAVLDPSAAPPSDYQLRIVGVPAGARVQVNGAASELPTRLPRGAGARIEVHASGFEPWTQTVTPTGDLALTYEGRPAAVPTPTGAGPSRGHPTGSHGPTGRNHGRPAALQGGVAPRPDF